MSENVTAEYLLSHGFRQYTSKEDGGVFEIPFYNDGGSYFREIKFDRNMFVVELTPRVLINPEEEGFSHSIYVQEDAGCGFVCIPEMWWDLPIEHFESIYYGIRGNKPIKTL